MAKKKLTNAQRAEILYMAVVNSLDETIDKTSLTAVGKAALKDYFAERFEHWTDVYLKETLGEDPHH